VDQYKTSHHTGINRFFVTGRSTFIGKISEIEGLRRDGRSFPMELSLSVSGGEDDFSVTGFFRDISERKAIQEQLIEMERQSSISTVAGGIGQYTTKENRNTFEKRIAARVHFGK